MLAQSPFDWNWTLHEPIQRLGFVRAGCVRVRGNQLQGRCGRRRCCRSHSMPESVQEACRRRLRLLKLGGVRPAVYSLLARVPTVAGPASVHGRVARLRVWHRGVSLLIGACCRNLVRLGRGYRAPGLRSGLDPASVRVRWWWPGFWRHLSTQWQASVLLHVRARRPRPSPPHEHASSSSPLASFSFRAPTPQTASGGTARRKIGATRQGWSEGSERCDDFMKFGSSSSGCEPRPAKGEPAQPVASLAASKETTAPMRRRASMWAVGNAATKTMSSRVGACDCGARRRPLDVRRADPAPHGRFGRHHRRRRDGAFPAGGETGVRPSSAVRLLFMTRQKPPENGRFTMNHAKDCPCDPRADRANTGACPCGPSCPCGPDCGCPGGCDGARRRHDRDLASWA